MAQQISALLSRVRASPRSPGALPRVRADFQRAAAKFKHSAAPGSPRPGWEPATSPPRGHISAGLRAGKFSSTPPVWKSTLGQEGRRGWLGRVALGAAVGLSTVALVRCLHAGSLRAMPATVNLDSPEGDWSQTKDVLLSLSLEDRRQHYRTPGFVPLGDIPVWTPAAGASELRRNEKLDQKISLYSGDITKLEIDAVVNAANKTLLGGGGVDGAIHRAAGPLLRKECASLHGCETGEAKITCGYGLPAKYVIHTVGPIAHGEVGEEQRNALRACYRNSLKRATENAARSVAFPCISTGIYGYPADQAVHEALATVREYLDAHHDKLDRVIFCVFLPKDQELYLKKLPLYFPGEASVKSKL